MDSHSQSQSSKLVKPKEKMEYVMGAMKDKARQGKKKASEIAQVVRGHTFEISQDVEECTGATKDSTGSCLQEKTGVTKEKALEAAHYAKETTQAKMIGMLSSGAKQVFFESYIFNFLILGM
ncbi:hypothetical protein MKX01_033040 [Papaver californicum]|nr:hypothetical protein MKX01_033040 [Papaver californicum]